jgi:hypothetical protein
VCEREREREREREEREREERERERERRLVLMTRLVVMWKWEDCHLGVVLYPLATMPTNV